MTDNNTNNNINEIVDAVIQSYEKHGVLDHLETRPMPSLDEVISILADLQAVLFPVHFSRRSLDRRNIGYHIGEKIDQIFTKLSDQIAKSFQHECPQPGHLHQPCDSCRGRGEGESVAFLQKIPALRDALAGDIQAAYDGDPAAKSLDEIIFCYPGFRAVVIHRIAHELHVQKVPLLPRIMSEYAHSTTGVDIHPGATIGRNFFIDHGTGVVIGETCNIGERVKLYQGVTLGALSFPTDEDGQLVRGQKRHPTIEDGVVIYANATVLGGRTVVGHDSVIGSSVWLTSSVAPHTTVVLEKPKLRMRAEEVPDDMRPEVNYQI